MATELTGRLLRLHTVQRYAVWSTSIDGERNGQRLGLAPVPGRGAAAEGPVIEVEVGFRAATWVLGLPPVRHECPGCRTRGTCPDGRGLLGICPVCNGRGWC